MRVGPEPPLRVVRGSGVPPTGEVSRAPAVVVGARRIRRDLRTRWASWVGIVLLVGLASGAAMTAAVGARRAASAYDRFLVAMRAPDTTVSPGWGADCAASKPVPPSLPEQQGALLQLIANVCLDDVAALPAVDELARVSVFGVLEGTTSDGVDIGFDFDVSTAPTLVAAHDDVAGTRVHGRKVLRGRHADLAAVDEVEVGLGLAHRLDVGVGDTLHVVLMDSESGIENAPGSTVDLHVVGVVAAPLELDVAGAQFLAAIHATPAFHARYSPTNFAIPGGLVALSEGSRVQDLDQQVRDAQIPVDVQLDSVTAQHGDARRATRVEALALWIVAGVVIASGAAFCGQALARQVAGASRDDHVLSAIGVTRRGLRGAVVGEAVVAGALGAGVGAGVAVASSWFMPIGLARTVEPDPGVHVDPVVLVVGLVATIAICVASVALVVARTTGSPRPSRAGSSRRQWTRALAPTPATAQGVRLALEPGRGAESVPVRSGLAGTITGAALLVAALVFSSSIDHLLATDSLAGWNWDAAVFPNLRGDDHGQADERFRRQLLADPDVTGIAAATGGGDDVVSTISVAQTRLAVLALEPIRGDVGIGIAAGRAPRGADEVAFGGETMAELDVSIGDQVEVLNTVVVDEEGTIETVAQEMRVVGRAVLPSMGNGGGPGHGAALTFEGFRSLATPAQGSGRDGVVPTAYLVRFREGADEPAALARLRHAAQDEDEWRRWARLDPLEADRLRRLPLAVAALVAALALGTLLHVTLATARRRRRELATLKSIGFVRRQLRTALWTQATTLVLASLAIGLPIGLALGGSAWTLYADQLAVIPRVDIPAPVIPLVMGTIAVALATVVAAVPAAVASRVPVAEALRTE